MKTFQIGRYYFDTLFRDEANEKFIDDLMKKPQYEDGNNGYALANLNIEDMDGYQFVRGTFTKYKCNSDVKRYVPEKNKVVLGSDKYTVEAQIEFIIHHPSHLIFFEKNSAIKAPLFRNKFKQIYKQNSSASVAEMEMDFVTREQDIYKEIESWKTLMCVKFTKLRATNPRMDRRHEQIDQLIRESGASRLDMKMQAQTNDGEGSLKRDSVLVAQATALAADGYGEAEFIGSDLKGELQTVTTAKFIDSITLDFRDGHVSSALIKYIKKDEETET